MCSHSHDSDDEQLMQGTNYCNHLKIDHLQIALYTDNLEKTAFTNYACVDEGVIDVYSIGERAASSLLSAYCANNSK